jgi:choline dehydrogenase-like flavoprotein
MAPWLKVGRVQYRTRKRHYQKKKKKKKKKRVILAAGDIYTLPIMRIGGLGPTGLLDSANVTTVIDLPGVGQNFQYHPVLAPNFTCKYTHL